MRAGLKLLVTVGVAWMTVGPVRAQDVGANAGGGPWEVPATWLGGLVPNSSNNVFIGSTYPPGAGSAATVSLSADEQAKNLYLGFGDGTSGTLVLGGHTLTVTGDISIGQSSTGGVSTGVGTIDESSGGSFQAALLKVRGNNSLTLGAGDVVSSLFVAGGGTVTTSSTGNVTTGVAVAVGGTLNLGADLTITPTAVVGSGQITAAGTGEVINMDGHAINAFALELGIPAGAGSPGTPAATLDRGGAGGILNLTGLLVSDGTLNLVAGDRIQALEAIGGTVTTAATGNATVDLLVAGGGTVKLGADLALTGSNPALTASGQLSVQDGGSVLDAQGHAVTADSFLVGKNGTAAVSVINLGLVDVNTLDVGNGSSLTLHGGDTIHTALSLTGASTLTVDQLNGTGLTFDGSSSSALGISSGRLDLAFTSSLPGDWVFRWRDPAGGNWVSTLDMMIGGQIHVSPLPGETYQVVDSGGFTYIEAVGTAAVPEPSSMVLAGLAMAGVGIEMMRRRRDGR